MNIIEVESDLLNTETFATIFYDDSKEFDSLLEFGRCCTLQRDENYGNDLYIEPNGDLEYTPRNVTEKEFWYDCYIKEYLKENLNENFGLMTCGLSEIICFWNQWNNKFYVIKTENGEFYGLSWGTTA